MKTKAVQQLHMAGCGPAALATVLETSYYKAVKIVFPKWKPRDYVSTWPYMMETAFRRSRIHYVVRRPKKWSPLPYSAIVNIQWTCGKRHWICWDHEQRKFLDPCSERTLKNDGKYDSHRVYVNAFNRGSHRVYELK